MNDARRRLRRADLVMPAAMAAATVHTTVSAAQPSDRAHRARQRPHRQLWPVATTEAD
jgi:hypothetical protein